MKLKYKQSLILRIKALIFKYRVLLANLLTKLAFRIRPKGANQWMQSIEDSLIYGNGVTRIDPKKFFLKKKTEWVN